MKKNILLYVLSLIWSSTLLAQSIEKGYHGFVDAGYSVKLGTNTASTNWVEFNTVHGYQINPYFFAGAGVGVQLAEKMNYGDISGRPYMKRNKSTEIPIFADLRYTILNKKVTPFIEARFGHYVTSGSGPYLSGGVGCRIDFGIGALNVKVAYTEYKFKYEELDLITTYKLMKVGYSYINMPELSYRYHDFKKNSNSLTFTVGYEF